MIKKKNYKVINYKRYKNTNLFLLFASYKLLILRNVFSKKEKNLAKNEIINFFKKKKYGFKPGKKLFHRWDFEPKNARYKRIMNIASFTLADKIHFPNCIKILKRSIKIKLRYYFLRKRIEFENLDFKYYPRASYYPAGGGYYEEHNDGFSKEKIIDIIPLSYLNKDFDKGGLHIRGWSKRLINIEKKIKLGDVVLMEPKTNHYIKSIDKEKNIHLMKKIYKGRFSLISVLN